MKKIGILTSGGDSPGINAVLRAIGKPLTNLYGMELIGFQDGFAGLADNRYQSLKSDDYSGILTAGGTILGTSRDHPERMQVGDKWIDRTTDILAVYRQHELDALVCVGGRDAQDGAFHLHETGLPVISLPVTIDNDIPHTDVTVGFDTAQEIAAEAIDRLHSTALSHHRIIIVEMMGRETGWLTLAAGLAGGADVILIPEIPYDVNIISQAIISRSERGKRFSLVAVSEGAVSAETNAFFESVRKANERLREGKEEEAISKHLKKIEKSTAGDTLHLANRLEKFTHLETRVTILGYLQRGGTPSANDRVMATQLGAACARHVQAGQFGVMVAASKGGTTTVPLSEVANQIKPIPLEHGWIQAARLVGVCLGDR